MNCYISTIVVFSIVATFICIITHESTQKYVSYLCSLIMILLILSPIVKYNILENYDSLFYHEKSYDINIDTNLRASEYLSKAIEKTILDKYQIKASRIRVETKESSAFDVDKIEVYVQDNINDTSKISKDLSNLYNCKIVIIPE